MKLALKVCELEHKLFKDRDICLCNREELFKELRAQFIAPLRGNLMDCF
jgi:hypothetical protein